MQRAGRVVTTGYDGAGREASVRGDYAGAARTYINATAYTPSGNLYYFIRGNNVWHATGYNARLQPTESYEAYNNDVGNMYFVSCTNWGDGPNGSSPAYTRGGFVYKICPDMPASVNNGNLQSYTELNGGPGYPGFLQFNQSYSYDALNRLTGVNDSGGYVRNFQYDTWGNMGVSNSNGVPLSGTTPLTSNNPFNTATNRLLSATYDAVGNQLNVGSVGLGYDAESRQVRSQDGNNPGVSYRYDGEGRRVSKAVDGGATTVYVYDALGKLISEYTNAAGNVTPPCWVCFPSYDHLGSVRMMTGHDGGIVSRHDYLPFGEEVFAATAGRDSRFGANDLATQRFTGTEADAESRLNFFQARYFGGTLGRFTSPDPGNAGADPSNPQSWNGYGYVNENPMNATDPTGLFLSTAGNTKPTPDPGDAGGIDNPDWCNGFCLFYNPFQTNRDRGQNGSGTGIAINMQIVPPIPPQKYVSPVHISAPPKSVTKIGNFRTLDCDGYRAARSVLPQTEKTVHEFGGFLYKNSNGRYSYSNPVEGNPTAIPTLFSSPQALVSGIVGLFHTHPLVAGYNNDLFSSYDLLDVRKTGPGYLGTATGRILKLTIDSQGFPHVTNVDSGACQVP